MTAAEFSPGPVITEPDLLREWLRFEEAVYIRDVWIECEYVKPYMTPKWPNAEALADSHIRQALRKVKVPK